MQALRKFNNNAVVCRDSLGREVVAFGKGIGFQSNFPRELDPENVERTFYNIDAQGQRVMQDLPSDVVLFTAKVMDIVANELPYQLSPNAVLIMADHISFAIDRQKNGITVPMPLAYDVQQTYPDEYRIGRYIVLRVKRDLGIELPAEEIAAIAMNIVNARDASGSERDRSATFEQLLDGITAIIESDFKTIIDRSSFDYSRFATHIQYLYQRIQQNESINSANLPLYGFTRDEFPELATCVDHINEYFIRTLHESLRDEEKLYLMLHVNRVVA